MHEAFFFGPGEQQLFAIYHPPANTSSRLLTVICPPLFAEFSRTHSVLRELAVALAECGQHVLRMDYRGTGDSFGNLEELSTSDWIQDITSAIQEGRELTGCNEVRVLGVRASALLACRSVATMNDVTRLVLWDPIVDGNECLKSLDQKKFSILDQNHFIKLAERRRLMRQPTLHNLSETMLEGFQSLDASGYLVVPKEKYRVIFTSSENGFPVADVSCVEVPFACYWEMASESLIVSQPILENLMQELTDS